MSLGKNPRLYAPALLALATVLVGGCHGGSGSAGLNTIASAVQDLTGDPEGTTTVITYASTSGLAAAAAANFVADGGQTAQSVDVAGSQATVAVDLRVSPGSRVCHNGLPSAAANALSRRVFASTSTSVPCPTVTPV